MGKEIVDVIFNSYFKGPRQTGTLDTSFITSINGTFICLAAAVLHHCLSAWSNGDYRKGPEFGSPVSVGMSDFVVCTTRLGADEYSCFSSYGGRFQLFLS